MTLYYLEEQTEEPILFQKPAVREELLGNVCRRPATLNFKMFKIGANGQIDFESESIFDVLIFFNSQTLMSHASKTNHPRMNGTLAPLVINMKQICLTI